jgi:tetratricopeptide (TPR) repeat protein
MEPGSIHEVTERLRSWCIQRDRGLARVEWDSAYARQGVVDRLKDSLGGLGVSLVEIELPPGEGARETATGLIESLRSWSGSVVSITGIEWAFPEHGNRLDTLQALSFQRETLASLPVRQIWWVPSSLTERFVLGVPDLDSWFRLRLHLTEVPPQPADAVLELERTDRKTVSVDEARSLARRFWERLEAARAQDVPEDRIWAELAQPAVDALLSAGLELEAEAILARMSDAREKLEHRIEELRSTRGPEDPEVLSVTGRLARLLTDQGDFAGARKLEERVLEVITRVLGEEHPDTLTSMNNLAETLWAQGDHAGARRLQERVLEVSTRVLGEQHPATLTSMSNLAGTLGEQGDLAGARRLHERVLELCTRVLGEEHPSTLTAMNNLASTLGEQGDHAGARRLQERVLEVRTRVLGEEHPDTLTSMANLAETLRAQGDHAGARRLQEQVLKVSARVLGEEHPNTLKSMNNLAVTLGAQGDHARARRLQEQVLELRTRVLGEQHPNTLTSMSNLASTLRAQGDIEGALRLLRKCLLGRRRALGEDHPDTSTTAEALRRLEAQAQAEPPSTQPGA